MGKKGGENNRMGFTLIELMVTIGIMVIINGVIFFNYPKVIANLALRRTADEIALTARQAQAYAMAAKSVVVGSVTELPSYGVHFDTSVLNNTKIILFADNDGGDDYDTSPVDEKIQTFEIQTKDKVSALLLCSGSCSSSNIVDVVYSRQSPTATITGSSDSVEITITAHRDSTMKKCVTINKNGYISVKNC
ncbi:MAG: prepilin-type N-terminal cleavage/methylation domain-containing protein [Patescibacteria group bacterium]